MKYSLNEIKKELQKIGASAVYLFGSRARNEEGPLSDYDFGVLVRQKIDIKKYFDIKLKLIGIFSQHFKTNNVDLVILNEAGPLLAMNIIKEGKIVYEKDKDYRVAFENYTMMIYHDRLPYEERYAKTIIARIK